MKAIKSHTVSHLLECIEDFFGNTEHEVIGFDSRTKTNVIHWLEDSCTDKEIAAFAEYV